MSIIVEDGSIVANANSYVSEAELATFVADRGITLTGDSSELILQAMDYIESLNFQGIKKTRDQSLQWPRINVWVDGYCLDSNYIPKELKNGLMQTCVAIDQGNSPQNDLSPSVVKEKVGDIEVQYTNGASTNTINVKISASLRKLLVTGGGGNIVIVSKG